MSTTLNIINYIEEKYGELFNKNEKIIIFRSNKWSVRYKIFDNTLLIINRTGYNFLYEFNLFVTFIIKR